MLRPFFQDKKFLVFGSFLNRKSNMEALIFGGNGGGEVVDLASI